ncbi:unknown similar to AMEV040 [Choristoneura rosaceana entomopoxvirus 'L']|uniref:Uncharacterized protein n=1 Tax=Choristoneura rosaceana entomopoxvirus 'L' TaxID=1293539 RepID=A0ABM9QKA0_9POXV|nr:unknown similar to AMEV040 [Choristoneura rosaceana entomopoxvirus 'L']CCU55964.1 unknown similar to AMEV040 [Choristoneura rosaceana entomopoxvirus 'L']
MTIDIEINDDIIDKIIHNSYKKNIPNNSIIKSILKKYIFRKESEIKDVLYIIENIEYHDNVEKKKSLNNNIYEKITFFKNYSPMLNYYDKNNINYKICDYDIDLSNYKYIKLIEYDEFNYHVLNKINDVDIYFESFIKGLYEKNKYYCKLLYFVLSEKYTDPDYIIDIIKVPEKINIIL